MENVDTLNFIFLVITYAGSVTMVLVVTLLSILSFALHRHLKKIWQLLISVGGSAITVFILKHLFGTARPVGAFYVESTPSFPSGHAAIAVALYGFIFVTIWKHEKHPLRNMSLVLLFLLIVLIGASRLYLGVHFITDIIAGYFIGLIWLCISLSKRLRFKPFWLD